MTSRWPLRGVTAALLAVGVRPALGQSTSATLPAKLAPATRASIEHLADSIRGVGLPPAPLYAKASEGVLKGADDARILTAVRSLAKELGDARTALGRPVDDGALTAAATAIHAGVPTSALEKLSQLSQALPAGSSQLAVALVTLADLVKNQVGATAAATAVEDLLAHRAPDDHYAALRLGVEQDIHAGRSPDDAVKTRTESIVRALGGRG